MSTHLHRRKYRKRPTEAVVAVPLDLETSGFTYEKWGSAQTCKAGDWIVNNDGEIYTVDRASFERTYRHLGGGRYLKTAPVWAEAASSAGHVRTKEGATRYETGDYLVSNEEDGGDAYAVPKAKFESMYELAGD